MRAVRFVPTARTVPFGDEDGDEDVELKQGGYDSEEWETCEFNPITRTFSEAQIGQFVPAKDLEKTFSLARRRKFYGALLPYEISGVPDAGPPFYHDVLTQILLYLPPDPKTLVAASQVRTTWRFFVHRLPQWSHIEMHVEDQRSLYGKLRYKRERTDPVVPFHETARIERERSKNVISAARRRYATHINDALLSFFVVMLVLFLGFVIGYYGALDNDSKGGSLCLFGFAFVLARAWIINYPARKAMKEPEIFLSPEMCRTFNMRRGIVGVALLLVAVLGTPILALTGRRLAEAEYMRDNLVVLDGSSPANLQYSERSLANPAFEKEMPCYVRLEKPLSEWEVGGDLPLSNYYDYAVFYSVTYEGSVPYDVPRWSFAYKAINTIQLAAILRFPNVRQKETAAKALQSHPYTTTLLYRGGCVPNVKKWSVFSYREHLAMREVLLPSGSGYDGRNPPLINISHPVDPNEPEDSVKNLLGASFGVYFFAVIVFVSTAGFGSFVKTGKHIRLFFFYCSILCLVIFSSLSLMAWGIACTVLDDTRNYSAALMCDSTGGWVMIGFSIPLTLFQGLAVLVKDWREFIRAVFYRLTTYQLL